MSFLFQTCQLCYDVEGHGNVGEKPIWWPMAFSFSTNALQTNIFVPAHFLLAT